MLTTSDFTPLVPVLLGAFATLGAQGLKWCIRRGISSQSEILLAKSEVQADLQQRFRTLSKRLGQVESQLTTQERLAEERDRRTRGDRLC